MTRNEYLAAYKAAKEIESKLVALRHYIDSCKHKNGFAKRVERLELDTMDFAIDLWNASLDSSKWS